MTTELGETIVNGMCSVCFYCDINVHNTIYVDSNILTAQMWFMMQNKLLNSMVQSLQKSQHCLSNPQYISLDNSGEGHDPLGRGGVECLC